MASAKDTFKWIASIFPAACCRVKRANAMKYNPYIRFPVAYYREYQRTGVGLNALFLSIAFISGLVVTHGISTASEISARAAVVMDKDSGEILFAKKLDLKLPPASTTKLVTAMVALDKLNHDTIVTVSEHAADTPSVEPRLTAGQRLSVKELLYFALMRSVNGAAVALAESAAGSESAFVKAMNKKAYAIGATSTRFINASGLPGRKQYTTAKDLAILLKESLKYPLISEIISTRIKIVDMENKSIFLKNTNYLLWTDDNQIGGKTGYTMAARHCLVSASRRYGRTLIVAILGERVRDNLWEDTMRLLDRSTKTLKSRKDLAAVPSHA